MKELWIGKAALHDLVVEANRAYPLETGGVLVGYFGENGVPVIYEAIGPGPTAFHKHNRFTPDHAWQCIQLDEAFAKTLGTLVYMGDWHTHPDSSPRMSWLDQRTLRSIAKHHQAKIVNPLMLIGGGSPPDRDWTCYQYINEKWAGLQANCQKLSITMFD